MGGPIKPNKLFYFFSLETTDSRAVGGPFIGSSALLLSLPPTEYQGGNFFQHRYGNLRPDDRQRERNGADALCVCQLPRVSVHCRSAIRPHCDYIPANRLSPVAQRLLADLPAPQTAGNVNNYTYALTSLFQNRFEGDVDADEPTQRQRADQRPARRHEFGVAVSGAQRQESTRFSLGANLSAKIFSYSLAATTTLTPNLVMDVVGGATTPHAYQQPNGPEQCWADIYGIGMPARPGTGRCPRMESRDSRARRHVRRDAGRLRRIDGFSSSVLDYNDVQYQVVANLGWTRGDHNVKFGGDFHWRHMNHYGIGR